MIKTSKNRCISKITVLKTSVLKLFVHGEKNHQNLKNSKSKLLLNVSAEKIQTQAVIEVPITNKS